VRLVVSGNVTIPAGMTVSASASENGPGAGGGAGTGQALGGAHGVVAPLAVLLGQMDRDDVNVFNFRVVGGNGGAGATAAAASVVGEAGNKSFVPQCCIGVHGPPFSEGWVGLPGKDGAMSPGGAAFANPLVSLGDPPLNGTQNLLQAPALGGAGGLRAGDRGFLEDGATGGTGGNGQAGPNGRPGRNGISGLHGSLPVR
jgi:hypothetical protein